jgi:Ca2+-transporting ATPase
MRIGILAQTLAITAVTLFAYWIGLRTHPEATAYGKTMAFVTLSFSELLRAFTARSENYPILKIGIFSNRSMNWAVLSSLVLLLAVVYIPFLNNIFDTVPLVFAQWQYLVPLLFVPALVAELTKWFTTRNMALKKSVNPL